MATPPRALSAEQARECAVRIDDAERHRLQIRQLSIEHPEMTIEDAYAVQREWVSMKLERGGRLRGRKVGLTSRAMQMSSQIDEPDYGDLLEDMFFDDGTTVPAGRFIVPRVEVELAFVARWVLDRGNHRHPRLKGLAVTDDADFGGAAEALGGEAVMESLRILHPLAVDAHHHVADLEARLRGWAPIVHALDQCAARTVEPKRLG